MASPLKRTRPLGGVFSRTRVLGLLTVSDRHWVKTGHTRSLTITETRLQHTGLAHPTSHQGGLGIAGVPIGYSWRPQEPAERP